MWCVVDVVPRGGRREMGSGGGQWSSQSLRTADKIHPHHFGACPCLYGKIEHTQGKSYPCPPGASPPAIPLRPSPKLCERPEQGKISASLSGLSVLVKLDFKVGRTGRSWMLPTAGHAAIQKWQNEEQQPPSATTLDGPRLLHTSSNIATRPRATPQCAWKRLKLERMISNA